MMNNTLQLGKYTEEDMFELTEEDVNGGAITLVTPLTPQFVEVTVAATATICPTSSCTSRC